MLNLSAGGVLIPEWPHDELVFTPTTYLLHRNDWILQCKAVKPLDWTISYKEWME